MSKSKRSKYSAALHTPPPPRKNDKHKLPQVFQKIADLLKRLKRKTAVRTRFRYYMACAKGNRCFLSKEIKRKIVLYGTDYGQYAVVPALLPETPVIITFGVGEDISFEIEMLEKHNAVISAFDPTPRAIQYVSELGLDGKEFTLYPYGLDLQDGTREFTIFDDNNPEASGNILDGETIRIRDKTIQVPMLEFSSCLELLKDKKIDILKMDIEGTEFAVLPQIVQSGYKPAQILAEFHERFYTDGAKRMKNTTDTLRAYGYKTAYVSANRQEVTFVLIENKKGS